ncbi:murein biosynthesis integral membrane protein MurJ [Terriglobus aquaticus]|uniref:Murein biosynthesis integral membrane protein MurJ n=1 Tax=Terriglobus aquaticus TaxID=940139 RepID=A0ABW9KHM0_9BACT|nr:lipid II flippase MurJ [Terriglobus aquaticus]
MSLPDNTSGNPTPASIANPNDAPEIAVAGQGATVVPTSGGSAAAERGWRTRLGFGGASSAFSASLLLMGSSLLSGIFSLLRNTLVARYFGTGTDTAAYTAAFQLPDTILYLLIGGAASSALISVLSRYRERGEQAEADRALCNILNVVAAVLLIAVLLGEVFAPAYIRYAFPKFREQPDLFAKCVHLTRILLCNPLFFFAGGVLGSRLLVRRIFVYQALQPVIYSGGILLGAVLLHSRMGVDSLAVGAAAGAFAGPLLMNYVGAHRTGLRWTPEWDLRHPALREWFLLNLPLMLGQSLTTTDSWIRNYFISGDKFDLSRLNFARLLFTAPMNVLGPAAGTASLPFFASLWQKKDIAAFSAAVDKSVSRMIAVSLLVGGWMIGLAPLIVQLVLRGGRFTASDSAITTRYFVVYTLSLFLWTSQNLYARAFYAAGDTFTPMVSGTVVTLVSIPVYGALYKTVGAEGLVWAADAGMLLHTGSLAVLLHKKRMVSIAELDGAELGKSLLAAFLGCLATLVAMSVLPAAHGRALALVNVIAGTIVWAGVCFAVLRVTGAKLPDVVLRRKAASKQVSASASQRVRV